MLPQQSIFLFFSQQLDGPFVWTKTAQGHILGAFFYGYLVSQVPAGMLAEHVGGKWVFTGIMALTAIPTLLTPPAANISYKMLIVLRVLVGIGSVGGAVRYQFSFRLSFYMFRRLFIFISCNVLFG